MKYEKSTNKAQITNTSRYSDKVEYECFQKAKDWSVNQ